MGKRYWCASSAYRVIARIGCNVIRRCRRRIRQGRGVAIEQICLHRCIGDPVCSVNPVARLRMTLPVIAPIPAPFRDNNSPEPVGNARPIE